MSLKNKLRSVAIDGLSRSAFFTPVMAFNEYVLADMEPSEVGTARSIAFGLNLIIGKPYGMYREWFARQFNIDEHSNGLRKTVVDTSAFVLSQIPVYSGLLYASGASLEEMLVGVPSGVVLSALTGRKYGKFLDESRDYFQEKPTLAQRGLVRTPLNLLRGYAKSICVATLLVAGANYAVKNIEPITDEHRLEFRPEMVDGAYWVKRSVN